VTGETRSSRFEIRCVVADGHPVFLQGVASVLARSRFAVAGIASTAKDTVAVIRAAEPNVAVLDPATLGMSAEQLADASAHTRVVIFTGDDGETVLRDALDAGAAGYAFKSQPLETIVDVVELVAGGGSWVDPAAAPAIVAHGADAVASLTPRERDVLALVAEGQGYQEIAGALSITVSTVQQHVASAMVRLSAESRTHAVATALRLFLID
jgi:DNA-binding NarL/FixJ family response regulator